MFAQPEIRFFQILLLLFFSPLGLSAQSLAAAAPPSAAAPPAVHAAIPARVNTLDETLAVLKTGAAAASGTAAGPRLEFRWEPFFQSGVFLFGDHSGAFTLAAAPGETGFFVLDSRELFTVPLPYRQLAAGYQPAVENTAGENGAFRGDGGLVFPEAFVLAAKDIFSRCFEDDASRFRIAAIVIDPGHGGKDPGAIVDMVINGKKTTVREKDIVLNVSKRLKLLLEQRYPEKRIMMTREGDATLALDARPEIANTIPVQENEAIIYISIHANSAFDEKARGYEVWYLTPNYRRDLLGRSKYEVSAEVIPILNAMLEEEFTTESVMIARSILRSFDGHLGAIMPSRGLKTKDWFVVRNSRMPAVLVELGFVTNREDAGLMTSEEGLQNFGEALYKGISEFVTRFEHSGGFTAAQ